MAVPRDSSYRDAMRKAFIGSEALAESGRLNPNSGLTEGSGVLDDSETELPPVIDLMKANEEAKRQGVMVALMLSNDAAEKLSIDGGEPASELHITLAYVGKLENLPEDVVDRVIRAVSAVSNGAPAINGKISGIGRFNGSKSSDSKDVVYASFSSPVLSGFRERLVAELVKEGAEPKNDHGFTPHITLAYVNREAVTPVHRLDDMDMTFKSVALVVGNKLRQEFALVCDEDEEDEDVKQAASCENPVEKYAVSLQIPIIKADEEKRLVTGIVLEPDEVDSQNDTVSSDIIEKAAHKFLARYNRSTRLGIMHKIFGEIGVDLVESFIVREDTKIGGQAVKRGSWLITVKILEESMWQKVKAGAITGFSIAGVATVI